MTSRAAQLLSTPFDALLPDPFRLVVGHAERFCAALTLAEVDESRQSITGPRELGLSETWIVGRAGEVEAFVADVVREWEAGGLCEKSASAVIEGYLTALHRRMASDDALAAPSCCSSAHESVTLDFFASARSLYPRERSAGAAVLRVVGVR